MGNTPNVRFKGFTEDWEQRKLGDEATEMLAGGDIDKSRVVKNGQYPIYANALTNDGIVGYYDDYYRVKAPAVTVTGRGDVGHAQARTVDFTPVVRLLAIRSEHDVYFLENAINKHGVIVESTGVPQLTVPQLGNYIISFPTTIDEEIKIGNYFHNLDHLITLHQQKCDETKEFKKYMLQNMFPQKDEKVPKIRFAGFTGDWEQRKLGDITVKIGSGKTPSGGKNAYVETGIPLIRSQNVNGDKVNFADIVYIDEATDESMANSRVYTNDVLLNITGASIGRSAVYKGLESANVNQHVCIIRSIEGHQPDFIQLNLSSDNGQKQIDESQAGGGREGLNFQEIGKMQFSFPSLNEQKCIGRYFNSLDNLITLHQQKCAALKEFKKYMLQNMFPQKGENKCQN